MSAKTLIVSLFLSLLVVTYAFAGPDEDLFQKPGGMPARLIKFLNLTPEQETQIKEIFKNHREDFKALREMARNNAPREEIRTKARDLRKVIFEEMKTILNPEQQQKLDIFRERLANGEFAKEMVENRLNHLTDRLNLSEEQRNQVRDILADSSQKLKSLRDQSTDRADFRREAMQIRENADLRILEILNPEQRATFHEMKEDMRLESSFQDLGMRLKRLSQALNLAPDQIEQFKIILKRTRGYFEKEISGIEDKVLRRQKMFKLKMRMDSEFEKILTPEQLQKYQEIEKEFRSRRNRNE